MSVTAVTTIRNAGTMEQERFLVPSILRQAGGLVIPWYNSSSTLTLLPGQPIVAGNRVCLVEKAIPPLSMGNLLTDWEADFLLDPGLAAADILQNAVINWDTTKNAVKRLDNNVAANTLVTGIGAATTATPGAGNGFLLGRAIASRDPFPRVLNGANLVVAKAGTSQRVTVVNLPAVATVY